VGVGELCASIASAADRIEGVTITGGEPLDQAEAVLDLLSRIRRETDLTAVVFTGYPWEKVLERPWARELFAVTDILVAGPYDPGRRRGRNLIGSENQTVHFLSGRYSEEDLRRVPPCELVLARDGSVLVSGVDPAPFSSGGGPEDGVP